MKMTLDEYRGEAQEMIDADRQRDLLFDAMDDYARCRWNAPPELRGLKWFVKTVSTGPTDALNAAARTLSTVAPKPHYLPLDSSVESRARADTIEKVLSWHYDRAEKRSVSSITRDLVMSALRYDEIAAQVIYLPWQRKVAGELGTKQKWWTGQGGDYAVIIHNPRDVHVRRNAYGIETVLLAKKMRVKELVATWGEKAAKVRAYCIEHDVDEVMVYDWTDDERRVVWVGYGETNTGDANEVVVNEEHNLPFLPWVSRVGGSAIDSEPEYQRRPLLAPIYWSNLYDITNKVMSLKTSLIVSHAAFPRTKSKTMSGETPDIDYTQPGGNVPLRPGEEVEPMQPPPFDPELKQIGAEFEGMMGKSTVPSILQDPNLPSGAAFASINVVLKSASNVLDPYRMLSENALSDVFTQMLMWLIHSKKNLMAYDTTRKGAGAQMMVKWDELAPEDIYINVNLTANIALDQMSRVNTAVMMKRELKYPTRRALEDLDITDPSVVEEEFAQESILDAEIQKVLKRIAAEGDAVAQTILGQAQMQQQQQMMAGQAAAPQAAPEMMGNPMGGAPANEAQAQQQALARAAAGMAPEDQLNSLGMLTQQAAGDLAFNPAMGGTPPAMMAPGVTREAVNGMARNGVRT